MSEELEESVEIGQKWLEENERNAKDAAFVFDARIPLEEKRYDALIIEIRSYCSPQSKAIIGVPYSPASGSEKFRVHKPKILLWEDCEDFDLNACINGFFDGVDSHEQGAKIWNDSLDQSV
ncbi:hypothetical protein ACJJIK_09150 [Microbulbifer sp. ZKSA006]